MGVKKFFSYIKYLKKVDSRNTFLYLFMKVVSATFFSVETIMIAYLLDNIVSDLSNRKKLVIDVTGLLAIWILKRVIEYFAQKRWNILRKVVYCNLPEEIVLQKKSLSYIKLENKDIQELIKRIGNETVSKFCIYLQNGMSLFVSSVEIMGLLIIISSKNILLGVLLAFILIPYVIFSVKNGKISYEAYEESEELFREADYYKEVINKRKYAEERTLFQFGPYFNSKWKAKYMAAISVENKANKNIFFRIELSNIMSTIVISAMFLLIISSALGSAMSTGLMISIMKSLINYIDRVSMDLSKRITIYEKGNLFMGDLMRFLEMKENENQITNSFLQNIKTIEFKNVSFAYPDSDKKVFENLSLSMSSDKQYAIVGENGTGKSTLLKLLMGIYTNYSGSILINDLDIKELGQKDLQALFAYVPQDVTKYEISLNEFLQEEDSSRIENAFHEYGVDFVRISKKQPVLGKLEEGAIDLSGGQWQLLSIVRASLARKELYILDEPTSAIDPIKEAELYKMFQKSMENKFTMIITHRLGAAQMSDEIIVLDKGSVAERGSHFELLEKNGIYSKMYNTQRKWYENYEG